MHWSVILLLLPFLVESRQQTFVNFFIHPFSHASNGDASHLRLDVDNGPSAIALKNGSIYQGSFRMPHPQDSTLKIHLANVEWLQDDIVMKLRPHGTTSLKVTTDEYRMSIRAVEARPERIIYKPSNVEETGCDCVLRNCACCLDVNLPSFSHSICANISYNAAEIGIDVSFGVDGHYITEELSVRNPPPICTAIPYVKDIIDACIRFKHLDVSRTQLSGCVETELDAMHVSLFHISLGCFHMPI